jgi:eukaryotic-like serine/threonine-protein kinase
MIDDPRLDRMLEELLESGGSPEEACRTCPDLLPQVKSGLQRLRRLEREFGVLFPPSDTSRTDVEKTPPPAELPRIQGYDVLAVLGRGGMGVVYKARHLRLDRPVALKMLLAGPYAGPDELERFLREAQAVAGLRHPNVVHLYDVGDVEGRPYFTMELIDGGSLALKLGGAPLPARLAASLVATIAEAVEAAHQSGIIHRDLKPANVMLTADGRPKVTDFGLARRLEPDGGLTLSGAPMGTPSYMAPEQARGDRGAIAPATDVYALGAILYECLTGRPPFRAETAAATLQQVLRDEPVAPSRLNPHVPRDVETICLKCLHKEPDRRYVTAVALADDLRRFERAEPIVARPLGSVERVARWARRRPTAAALTAVVLMMALLALTVAGGGLWLSGQRQATARAAEEDLREADRLMRQADLTGVRAALERVKGRLGGAGPAELQERIALLGRDLEERVQREEEIHKLRARLQTIRLNRAVAIAWLDNRAQSDSDYEEVFRSAGLGSVGDAPAAVAERVKASPASRQLVGSLDDWAVCATAAPRRTWVLEVARAADPNPWRNQVRDPEAPWADRTTLLKLAAAAPVEKESVELLVALGDRLFHCGAEPDAIQFMRRVQQAHPDDFYANCMLAHALRVTHNEQDAVGFFRAALAVRPDTAAAWYDYGESLRMLGRSEEAIVALERCVKLDPGNGWAHASIGNALRAQRRPEEAVGHYRLALLMSRPTAQLHTDFARALQDAHQWDEAIRHFRSAVALDPRNASTHYDLGMALNIPGREDDAIAEFREAVSLNSRWGDARANLGRALTKRNLLDEAASQLREAVVLTPADNAAQAWLRDVLILQGRPDEAWAAWRKALEAGPHEHDAWFGFAELCLFLGHEQEYRRHRRTLFVRFGGATDINTAERTGRACLLLPGSKEELDDAAALVERAVATSGRKDRGDEFTYPYCLFAKGLADYRYGRFDDAIAVMNGKAADATYLWPSPRLVAAMALYRKGQKQQALKSLAAAIASYDWSAAKADSRDRWIIHILRREAEALILPDLSTFLDGKHEPQNNDERVALMAVCQFKDLRAVEAGLYAAAFADDPKLAEDLAVGHRWRAARAAAVAGCGGGADGFRLSATERARWRKQAREWLRLELDAWTKGLKNDSPTDRAAAHQALARWRDERDLSGLRDSSSLEKLPAAERLDWRSLWSDFDVLVEVAPQK